MSGHIPKTILLVEDDATTAALASQTITEFGYVVVTACSGEKAVELVKTDQSINLILMDIDLGPGIDGTEAAKLILALKNIPIVFLTSHSERDMVEKVRGITRYGYIIKNSGDFVLRSSIEMAFELFEAHRNIEAKMDALRENEEIFNQFMKHSPIYVFFKDSQIKSLRLSDNYEKMLERPLNELIGKNMDDLFPSDFAKKMVADDIQILKEGKVKYIDEEFNGRKYTTIKYPIHINDNPTYLAGFTIDVTDRMRIEEALREGEAKLSAIFENSCDAIGVSKSGTHTLVNPAYAALFGYQNAAELSGIPVLDLIAPNERDSVWQKFQKRLKNEPTPSSYDTLGLRKDGTIFDMEVNASIYSLRDEIFTVAVTRDISMRKRTEESLQKSEAQKNAILNGITANIAFVDSNLKIIWANRTAAESVNRSPDEMAGHTCHEFWADPLKPCCGCPTLKAFQTKKTEAIIMHTPDGRIWEERGEPVFDQKGNLIGVVEIARDITDSKNIEEALQKSEKRFRLSMEATRDGLWDWDIRTGDGYFSPGYYHMLGYDADSFPMTGNSWLELMHPDDRVRTLKANQECIDGRCETFETEFRMKAKNGEWRWIMGRGKCVERDEHKRALRLVGTHVDITDRKLAEEKIKMLLAEKELMLKEVHHRIKNNMNTIAGLLFLQANMLKESAARSALMDSKNRVMSMMVLYDKLYCSDDFNEISIKDYLEPLLDEIINMFPNKTNVKIIKNIDDFKLESKILSPLGIIVNELITNIMKYAFGEGGDATIGISASAKNGRITCVIEDNGKGLPESINLDSPHGFGLQLVDMLVKQIDGDIRIERSEGTRFIIEFKA